MSQQPTRFTVRRGLAAALAALVVLSTVTGFAAAAGQTDLLVSTDGNTLTPGETTTVTLAISNADGGVGSADFRVELSDPSVAAITGVAPANDPPLSNVNVDADGGGANVNYALSDSASDTGQVAIATVTIEGQAVGSTDLDVVENPATGLSVGDESGSTYDLGTVGSATLTVEDDDVDPNAAFAVTPTTPVATEQATFDASASADTDGTIESYEWDFDGDGQVDATGETVSHAFAAAGEYAVSLTVTDDDGNGVTTTRTITVDSTPAPTTPGTVDVSLEPATSDLAPGDTETYDVVVTGADEVGSFEGSFDLTTAGVATITGVETAGSSSGQSTTNDGSSATMQVFLGGSTLEADADGRIVVATITVEADATGSTALAFGDDPAFYVTDETGASYEVGTTTDATVDVSFPPLAPGLGSPTNVDDDPVLEDVNGDGVFNAGDAQTLFSSLDDDTVLENVERFDFNGDGRINIGDAQAAFYQAING